MSKHGLCLTHLRLNICHNWRLKNVLIWSSCVNPDLALSRGLHLLINHMHNISWLLVNFLWVVFTADENSAQTCHENNKFLVWTPCHISQSTVHAADTFNLINKQRGTVTQPTEDETKLDIYACRLVRAKQRLRAAHSRCLSKLP